MSEEPQERIFNEIAKRCGLLTQYHIAFLSSDNTAFRYGLSTTGHFTSMQYKITWAVWMFVDYSTIHVQSKSRYTKEIRGDYSNTQLEDVIEDIKKIHKRNKTLQSKRKIKRNKQGF